MSNGCEAVLVHLAACAQGCIALYRIVLSQRHLYGTMLSGSLHTILHSFRQLEEEAYPKEPGQGSNRTYQGLD